jgi:hypothetical protein
MWAQRQWVPHGGDSKVEGERQRIYFPRHHLPAPVTRPLDLIPEPPPRPAASPPSSSLPRPHSLLNLLPSPPEVAAGHAGTDRGAGSAGAKTVTRRRTGGSNGGDAGGGCPPCPRRGLARSPGACPQRRPSLLPPLHQALPSSSLSSSVAQTHRPPPPAMHRVDIARSGRHGPRSPSPVATARGDIT